MISSNIKWQAPIRLKHDTALATRNIEIAAQAAVKHACHGRLGCLGAPRKARAPFLANFEPGIVIIRARWSDNMLCVVVQRLRISHVAFRCMSAMYTTKTPRKKLLPSNRTLHYHLYLFVQCIEHEAEKFFCIFLVTDLHHVKAAMKAHCLIHVVGHEWIIFGTWRFFLAKFSQEANHGLE